MTEHVWDRIPTDPAHRRKVFYAMRELMIRHPDLYERDAFILVMRGSNPGGKPPSYASIGQRMGIGRERTRQLYKRGQRIVQDGNGEASTPPETP